MTLLPDGKVMVDAVVSNTSGNNVQTTFKIKYPSITLDSSYGINGMGQLWTGAAIIMAQKMTVNPDGSTYSLGGGEIANIYDTSRGFIIKRKPNGMLDSSWQQGGVYQFLRQTSSFLYDMKVAANGDIYTCGYYRDTNTIFNPVVIRLHPDGSLDNTFGVNGVIEVGGYLATGLLLNTDGTFYVKITPYADNDYIVKYKLNGIVDSTFGINGRSDVPSHPPGTYTLYAANSMITQSNGKILMIGTGQGIYDSAWVAAWRVLPNGNMDSTFGLNGIGNYHIMPDSIPPNFPSPIIRLAGCGALQSDGKILMGGFFEMGPSSYGEMVAMRLNNIDTQAVQTRIPTVVKHSLNLQAYPVPANNTLYLRYTLPAAQAINVTLTDVYGRAVLQKSLTAQATGMQEVTLSLPALADGIYLLRLQGDGMNDARQIVVRQ